MLAGNFQLWADFFLCKPEYITEITITKKSLADYFKQM